MKKKTRISFHVVPAFVLGLAIEDLTYGVLITCLCFRLAIIRDWVWPEGTGVSVPEGLPLYGTSPTAAEPIDAEFIDDGDQKMRISFPVFGINYEVDQKFISQVSPGLTPATLLSIFQSPAVGSEPKEIGRIEFGESYGNLVLLAKLESNDPPDSILGRQEFSDLV